MLRGRGNKRNWGYPPVPTRVPIYRDSGLPQSLELGAHLLGLLQDDLEEGGSAAIAGGPEIGDRPGLLSRVARCLVDYGINLHTAKINTLGDRAEDVFLINGAALNDPKKVLRLESDLVRQLQT